MGRRGEQGGTHPDRLALVKDPRQDLVLHAPLDLAQVGRAARRGRQETLDVLEMRDASRGYLIEEVEDDGKWIDWREEAEEEH